jgi:hypothetical protein
MAPTLFQRSKGEIAKICKAGTTWVIGFFLIGFLITGIVSLFHFLILRFSSFEALEYLHLKFITASERENLFLPHTITIENYKQLQNIFLFVLLTSGVCFFFCLYAFRLSIWKFYYHSLRNLFQKIVIQLKKLTFFQKSLSLLSLILLVLVRLYFLYTYPLDIDEGFSYIYFVKEGALATAGFYVAPNNHVLYNLLCTFLTPFFNNPFWVMKLPTFFISVLTTFLAFILTYRYFGFITAFASSWLFSFSYFGIYYSIQGRGYSLLSLCTIILAFAGVQLIRKPSLFYHSIFTVAAIAGLYTIPVFLYPFITVNLFLLIIYLREKRYSHLFKLSATTSLASFTLLLLYLPIIYFNGFQSLIGNKYVQRVELEDFASIILPAIKYAQGLNFGQEAHGLLIVTLVALMLGLCFFFPQLSAIITKQAPTQKHFLQLSFWLITSLLVFLVIQGVVPPPRVWFYKSFFDFLGLVLVLQVVGNLIKIRLSWQSLLLYGFCVFFSIYQSYHTWRYGALRANPPRQSNELSQTILKMKAGSDLLITDNYFEVYFSYFSASHKRIFSIHPVVVSVARDFEVIITGAGDTFPLSIQTENYKEFYQDHFVKAFRRMPSSSTFSPSPKQPSDIDL